MKSLLVILLLAAVASAESDEKRQVCEPGSTWKQACNTCFCSEDGFGMGCTMMACNPNVWNPDGSKKEDPSRHIKIESTNIEKRSVPMRQSVHDKTCQPGKPFKHYCNTCVCTKYGRVGRCTRMLCDESVYNEDGTFKYERDEKKCQPGRAYSPDGCNTCICNEYGSGSLCTSKSCRRGGSNNQIEETPIGKEYEALEWGSLYRQGDSCTPGESFYSLCNRCVCARNGKGALCTTARCRRV